ncbi:hypothetical protein NC653_040395 [Populus alba x Populus x berolinensis]|uniref:Uncharacterized protein n=1 Tax=Populus alba x Populus x berolinensis TaxID=444605 RepID=A0AAD6PRL4_9ROSI|nr:hypothetical protein NC653_040395 [Populus alba x Populus x berolinensis]
MNHTSNQRKNSTFQAQEDFHKDLMAGALLGGVVHTIVAPIEREKVLLQTQESNLAIVGNGRRKFKGMASKVGFLLVSGLRLRCLMKCVSRYYCRHNFVYLKLNKHTCTNI